MTPRQSTTAAPRPCRRPRSDACGGTRRDARRPVSALLVVLGAVLALLLGGAGSASAHAALVSTTPGQDAVVASAPVQVTLAFSEGVRLAEDSVRVYDPAGTEVDQGSPVHVGGKDSTAAVSLRSGLGQGTYTVSWRAVSEDSHPVSGAFTFSIGKRSQTSVSSALAGQEHGSTAVGFLYGTGRAVAYGAFALLVGTAAFVLLCWPRGVAAPPVQRLLMTGWGGLLLSTVAVLLLRGPYENGSGLGGTFDLSLVRTTLDERLGTALAARLLLLAAAGVFLSLLVGQLDQRQEPQTADGPQDSARERTDPEDPEEAELRRLEQQAATRPEREARLGLGLAGLLLAVALAATWAGADHAAVGFQAGLALPVDVLHLVAMAVWLGGLATLLVGMRIPPARGGIDPAGVALFSRTALGCVTVLVATGSYQAWRGLGSWKAFVDTGYGRLLLVKIGCVAAVVALAWISRSWTARLRGAVPAPRTAAEPQPVRGEPLTVPGPGASGGGNEQPGNLADSPDPAEPEDPERRAQLARQRAARTAAAERRARAQARSRRQEDGEERTGLRRSVLAETAVATAVLVVTTLLTNAAPGRAAQAAAGGDGVPGVSSAAPAPRSVSLTLPYDTGGSGAGAKGSIGLTLDPGGTGGNEMHLLVADSTGRSVDVPEVRVAFSLPARKLGPLRATLRKAGTGHWSAQAQLPMAGDWQVAVTVRSSDIEEDTVTAPFRIG
jgi:copper transport protein